MQTAIPLIMLMLLPSLMTVASGAHAQAIAGGPPTLTLDDTGRVTALEIAGTNVRGGAAPAPLVALADVTRGPDFVPGAPTDGDLQRGLTVAFEGLDATAIITTRDRDGALRFTCRLVGREDLPARGVLLRFAFPVDAVGWRWHEDMQTARVIEAGATYENVTPLREWPDLPEWADRPSLRMGASNRNFATVLTGPVGLSLALPIDRPSVFRTAYDAEARQIHLVYDLALSPDMREPNRWTFAFDLYPCDPAWGFRSALEGYYALYPELFTNYVERPGQWMAFSRLSQIDNVNEFLFGVQWGAPEVAYDDKIEVPSVIYLTHAGQFARIPDYDPEKDPLPPHDAQLAAMTEAFRRTTGAAEMFPAVGLYDAEGKLDIRQTRAYGHIISQFNMSPELPYGQWLLERAVQRTDSIREQTGGELDGFGYDGLCTGLNYRAEHFRSSIAPPLWDPVSEKALLNNHYDSCAFARAMAELLRERGQISVMNGALHASPFVAPWLDVFGAETGLRISRGAFNYVRSISRHKPVVTLLKGNYEQVYGRAEIELFMKRALAYGVFPGFFDWFTSGLGPGGRYWDHPKYYERDRDLFRKYLPLVQTLAMAGWEPVTHARSSHERVFVERFGPGEDGVVWLTLLNEDAAPYPTTVTVDAAALGLDLDTLGCMEVLSEQPVELRQEAGRLALDLHLEGDGVAMVQLATPAQAAAWRLAQAHAVVERGLVMREVDADKQPLAVSWHPGGETYLRETTPEGQVMVLRGDERGAQSAWQWAMLFQPEAAPVTLRVRAAGEDIAGEGNLRIRARHAWVSPSFSYYENEYLDFPKGTYDYRDFELTITPEQPLRGIHLQTEMDGALTGTLRIASITLRDRFRNDYVHNPQFGEWYEPVAADMTERLATETVALGSAVWIARGLVADDLAGQDAREALLEVGGLTTAMREWIAAEGAENGCRRALRDVETVEHHLGFAALAALGLAPPTLEAPARVAAGDEVPTRIVMPAHPEVPIRVSLRVEGRAEARVVGDQAIVRVHDDAEPGETVTLTGEALIGPEGRAVAMRVARAIEVVAPLEVGIATLGSDTETGALLVAVTARNNLLRAQQAQVTLGAPAGWQAPDAQTVELPSGEERAVRFVVTPTEEAQAGRVELSGAVTAAGVTVRAQATVLHIPPEANLVRNPGFEDGLAAWGGTTNFSLDTEVAHSGNASVRLHNDTRAERAQISQTVTLNQERAAPILVRVASRAEGVQGTPGRGYCLYVDIYYTDGTPLYGRIFPFPTGTTDWQVGELVIEPEKPIRNANVYLLLRDMAGTVWFDDVALMEDPLRRGNIAREAEVSVDGSYGGYDPSPLTDGIIHPSADAHWTKEAWASAETADDHWIELRFDEPRTVTRAVIYWSRDAGIPRTSVEAALQVPEGDGWRTVMSVTPERQSEWTEIALEGPVTATAFRLLQPAGKGSESRPNLMWVREVEMF